MKSTKRILSAVLSIILALTLTLCLFGCDLIIDDETKTEASATAAAEETTALGKETAETTESSEEETKVAKEGLWENATYLKDMTFGEGSKTVVVEVKVGEDSVIFTVKTDKDTVGAALIEHNLIEGDESQYGLYVKKVNGILADYDIDQSYWSFYINGEYAMSGVDTTDIDTSATYKLEYTK